MLRTGGRARRLGPTLGGGMVALACGLGAGCGGSGAGPDVLGSPAPLDAGLLHVARNGSIVTSRIDGGTGLLTLTGTRPLTGVESIAVEPSGRFLYAGVETDRSGIGGRLVTLAIDRASGTLSPVGETPAPPCVMTYWGSGAKCEWRWLQASATRVVAMWWNKTYHDNYHRYVSYDLDAEGRVASEYLEEFDEYDPGDAVADIGGGVFYKAEYGEQSAMGLAAYDISADGRLARSGFTSQCGGSTILSARPLEAGGGLVFTDAVVDRTHVVCSHRGDPLQALEAFPFWADAAAFLPPAGGRSSLLAFADRQRTEVRVAAVTTEGSIQPGFSLPYPEHRIRELLFHPGGRLLFVLDWSGTVSAYLLEANGGRFLGPSTGSPAPSQPPPTDADLGRGRMAVTLPAP